MNNRGIIRPHEAKLDFLARLADAGLIALAMYLVCLVFSEQWGNRNSVAVAAAVLAFNLIGQLNYLYRSNRGEPVGNTVGRVWSAWLAVVTLLLMAAFATKTSAIQSRRVILIWFVLAPSLLSGFRVLLAFVAQRLRSEGHNSRRAAVVGISEVGERIAHTIVSSPWMGIRFGGFYEDRTGERVHRTDPSLGEVAGNFDDLVEGAKSGEIDLVYIALPLKAEPRINQLIRRLSDTTASVFMGFDFGGFNLLSARWGSVGDVPVIGVVETPFYGVDGWVKRAEDIVLGSLILLLISIPMAIIAVAVKLTSPGPALFRQRRYGLNGETINVLKFRSMTVCEDGERVRQARKNDQRVTPLGAFLRRTSLDELPQFLNVITGEMSIVGPRPHAIAHNEQYRALIEGYMLRHKVKPGITGWAQVNGWRGETDTLDKMQHRVEYDLAYIRNFSLGLDLKIIAMTVFGEAVRRNAY